jgi:hypothetical protein
MTDPETKPLLSQLSSITPEVEEINRISSLTDPVNRNLQITNCYSELSSAFARRTGIVANWCTFATWASKQAGVTIRGEDLKRRLEEELSKEPGIKDILSIINFHFNKLVSGAVLKNIQLTALQKLIQSAMEKAGDAVSRGNKKVFEEIGKEFAVFINSCLKDEGYKESSVNDFCKHLSQGPPPNGQEWLERAFKGYYNSLFEKDQKTRDEMILMANIEIGFHEQTRLQPEIAESLDAGLVDPKIIRGYLTDILVNSKSFLGKFIYFFRWLTGGTKLLTGAIDQLVFTAEKPIRRVITKQLMTLNLPPATCLHLGDDLNAPYPVNLRTIEDPGLISLLVQVKPSADIKDGAGCNDWADLKQRIHYIANLFRCYQETKELFSDAFTAEQITEIKAGRIPAGNL